MERFFHIHWSSEGEETEQHVSLNRKVNRFTSIQLSKGNQTFLLQQKIKGGEALPNAPPAVNYSVQGESTDIQSEIIDNMFRTGDIGESYICLP